ncbi:hypothetical protein ABEB36_002915 [Hypothenemus hampei]
MGELELTTDDLSERENDETEIIHIEVTKTDDDVDSNEDSVNIPSSTALRIKCQNPGCSFSCGYDLGKIRSHRKSCPFRSMIETKSNEFTYYKCGLCGVFLVRRIHLPGHVRVHGKERGQTDGFQAIFGVYQRNEQVDEIIIKAAATVLTQKDNGTHKKSASWKCSDCNFKTSSAELLSKHKKLHWSAEKELAFAAKKWHTCQVCQCKYLTPDLLQEHMKKHRKKYISNKT